MQADARASARREPSNVAVAMTPTSNGVKPELEQVDRQQQADVAVAERAQSARPQTRPMTAKHHRSPARRS